MSLELSIDEKTTRVEYPLSEEFEKLRLRCLLLDNKGNLDEVANYLNASLDHVLVLIKQYGLNLDHYRRLTHTVGPYSEEVDEAAPYWPEDSHSTVRKNVLNELGWRQHRLKGMEILEKGPTYTTMTARVVIDHDNAYYHILYFQLLDLDNKQVSDEINLWIFSTERNLPSYRAVQYRKSLILAIAEPHLTTGLTNNKDMC